MIIKSILVKPGTARKLMMPYPHWDDTEILVKTTDMDIPRNAPPKYARFICNQPPYIDRVIDYDADKMDRLCEGDVIEIDAHRLGGFYHTISGDFQIIKIRNDLLHNYYWLETV